MYRWMQANSKKMMAIFGVLLMIVFVLPTTTQFGSDPDPVRGHVGEEKITATQLMQAAQEWEFLSERVAPFGPMLDFGDSAAWPHVLFAENVREQFDLNPELFFLLQREARQMGVQVHRDRLNQISGALGTILPRPANLDEAEFRSRALEHLLLVGDAFDRAGSAIKISEPRVKAEMAEQYQTLRVKLVDFRAADFIKDVPAPTAEQVQAQIDAFGDVDPDKIDAKTNPFGFSYKLPNRVKLQYIQIPREPVRQVVEKSQSEFEWRSQAYNHYEKNKTRYETTEPATQPAESTVGQIGDLTMGPSTQPAEKPIRVKSFDEVYAEIKSDLLRPKVDARMKQIQDRIASLLTKGYERYEALKNNKPAPESTGIKADYASLDYLNQVAQQIEKEFGVRPTVQSLSNRWLAESDLMTLPDIGLSMLPGRQFTEPVPFANYVLSRAEPFRNETEKQQPDALSLWEPSGALTSPSQDAFIFRLTDAQAAHKPTTPEERQEVADRAEQDLKTVAAYQKALEAAKALHEQAQSAASLADAAAAANRRVESVGPIARVPRWFRERGMSSSVVGYTLSSASREAFADAAYDLLRDATAEAQHPQSLVELPREARVAVIQLDSIERQANNMLAGGTPLEMTAMANLVARGTTLLEIAQQWFNPDSIRQRTAWKPV
jgi:hypothetical protein